MKNASFHLSLPCSNINETKAFYVDVLGAQLGRNSHLWLDINLFGNQITFTKSGEFDFSFKSYKFENTILPSFHFGVIIDRETWNLLYKKLVASSYEITTEVTFLKQQKGEHRSFFIEDPNEYTVEFKCFEDANEMFEQ